MANKYTQKYELTQQILEQLKQSEHYNVNSPRTVTIALMQWWRHPSGGWQLSFHGRRVFNQLDVASYKFELTDDDAYYITGSFFLLANKKLQTPYYINMRDNVIEIFGSKDASMIKLMGGDVQRYLEQNC